MVVVVVVVEKACLFGSRAQWDEAFLSTLHGCVCDATCKSGFSRRKTHINRATKMGTLELMMPK